jgi:uncharacterized paraquat-inducible protein A
MTGDPGQGQGQPPQVCRNCGTQVPAGTAFCPNCGEDMRPRRHSPWGIALAAIVALLVGAGIALAIAGTGNNNSTTITVRASTTTTGSTTTKVSVQLPTKTVTAPAVTITRQTASETSSGG